MEIYSQYGIDPYSSTRANDLQAAITRAQYDDYQKRFSPWLNTLTNQVSDAEITRQKNQWSHDIQNGSEVAAQNGISASNRNLSRFGVTSGARTDSSNKALGLLGAKSNSVAGINNMNQAIDDRVIQLMSGQTLSSREA